MKTSIINSITGYQKISVSNHINGATIVATYEKIPDSILTSLKNIFPLPEKKIETPKTKTIFDKLSENDREYNQKMKYTLNKLGGANI